MYKVFIDCLWMRLEKRQLFEWSFDSFENHNFCFNEEPLSFVIMMEENCVGIAEGKNQTFVCFLAWNEEIYDVSVILFLYKNM